MTNAHSTNFGKLVTAAKEMKTSLPLRRAERLEAKVIPAIGRQIAQTKGPIKKLYERAYNSCVSLAEGIKTDDVSDVDYQEFIGELATYHSQCVAIEETPVKEKNTDEAAWQPDSEKLLENQTQHARSVIQKYKKYEPMVPTTLAKKFVAKRLPVMALTKPGLQRDALTSMKLLDDTFFGYPIIRDQVLLGLNSDWVTADYKRDTQAAITDVVSVLNQQYGKRFYPLGQFKKRRLVDWVWLVDDQMMRKLNKASMSGHFLLEAWAFPFEADDVVKKPAPEAK